MTEDTTELKKQIENCVAEILLRPARANENLFTDRILDSISVVDLSLLLEKRLSISISASEMTAKNFDSVEKMTALVLKKRRKPGEV